MDSLAVMTHLLRCGLGFNTHGSIELNPINWERVELLANKQNVLPLVFDGYERYYEKRGLEAPIEKKLQWFAVSNKAERTFNEHLNAIRTMTEYLAERNLRVMVLKGYSLSLCYPKPSHRPCGDIDIYCFGDYKKVDETVMSIALCKVDKSHHHHTVFHWNGIMVENHYDFVNVYAHKTHKKADKILKQMAAEEEPQQLENGVLLASPNVNVLFTLIHNAEHFACESIDLRRLCDWWLLRKQYADKADWQKVEAVCEELGLAKFMRVMDEVCRFVLEDEINDEWSPVRLSEDGQRVLVEILHPQFENKLPKGVLRVLWWKFRRWWTGRWKMRLVYQNENLTAQFFYHLRSHLMKPANMLS